MTEDSTSGNRWEPTPPQQPADETTDETTVETTDETTDETTGDLQRAPVPPADGPRPARRITRKRGLLAGVAAALFLVGGAGGFAVGHATAGDAGGSDGADPYGHHDRPPGLGPDGSGGHGFTPGQVPGQVPGEGSDDGTTGDSSNGADT